MCAPLKGTYVPCGHTVEGLRKWERCELHVKIVDRERANAWDLDFEEPCRAGKMEPPKPRSGLDKPSEKCKECLKNKKLGNKSR